MDRIVKRPWLLKGRQVSLPATSLDLSFMTGTLDPSITFTRASTATYFDATGTLQTAATNAPRFDYDPVTHALRGLLIEEQRVNQLIQTTNMVTSWAPTQGTATPAAGSAPDGTNNAASFIGNTLNSGHYIQQTANIPANSSWALTFFVKLIGAQQYVALSLYDNTAPANVGQATYNLVTQTIGGVAGFGTSTVPTVSMQALPNGWFRLSMTCQPTTAANTGVLCRLFLANGIGSLSYPGDGVSGIYVWGAQVENGPFPTSYIPTTSAAITRSADAATTPTGAWFNASTGTLVGDYMVPYWPLPSGSPAPAVVELNDGTITNIITLRLNPPQQILATILIASTSQGQLSITGGLVGTNKVGLTYTNSAMSLSANGSVAQIGAVTALPTINRLTIGFGRGGTLNGWVRRTRYWNTALSSLQLQQATR